MKIIDCIMFQMAFWGNSNFGLLSFVLFLYLVDNHLEEKYMQFDNEKTNTII